MFVSKTGIILFVTLFSAAAFAQTESAVALNTINSSWLGGFGNWSTIADWNPTGAPDNSGGNTYNVTIDTSSDSVTLDIAPTINSLTLGGSSGSSDLFTRSNNLTVTGALDVNQSGSLFVQSTVSTGTLSNTGYLQIYSGATVQLTNQPGGITDIPSGSFWLIQGSLTAGSQNGFAGLSSIEGELELENGQTTTVTPGTGTFTISGSGSLVINPGATATSLTINGNMTNNGAVAAAGNIKAGILDNTGSFTVSSGGTASLTTLTNTGTFAVNNGGSVTVTNPISDVPAGSVIDVYGSLSSGSGTALAPLSGVEGSLELGNGQTATITPTGGTLTVSVSGTLIVDNPHTSTGTNLTISGNLTNDGSTYSGYNGTGGNVLTVTGGLTNGSFANLYVRSGDTLNTGTLSNSGNVSISSGGTLNVTSAGSSTNGGTITAGGTLAVTGTGTLNLASGSSISGSGTGTLTNAGTIEGEGSISNIAVTNTGTILANQSSPLAIQPDNGELNNKGTLNVSAGDTLQIGTSAGGALTNFSGTTLTGGTYKVSGTLQFGSSGTTIATNAANITLTGAGQIMDFGNHNVLAGFNNNAAAGVFMLSSAAALTTSGGNFTNAGLFTVSSGTTFTIGGSGFNFTQSGGTTTVDGTLTSTGLGTVSVNGGSFFGRGTVGDNLVDTGTLMPGDSATKTGKLTVSDAYTQNAAGALDIAIDGTKVASKYDQLDVTKSAALAGTLNVSLGSAFTPTVGEKFTILKASSLSGKFTTVNGLAIDSSEHFTVKYTATSVILTVVSGALPGSALPPALRRSDELMTLTAAQPAAAIPAISAASYNGMAAMNHLRFECGVDVNALLKMTRKQLWHSLWRNADATPVAYMVYNGSH